MSLCSPFQIKTTLSVAQMLIKIRFHSARAVSSYPSLPGCSRRPDSCWKHSLILWSQKVKHSRFVEKCSFRKTAWLRPQSPAWPAPATSRFFHSCESGWGESHPALMPGGGGAWGRTSNEEVDSSGRRRGEGLQINRKWKEDCLLSLWQNCHQGTGVGNQLFNRKPFLSWKYSF